MNAMRDVTVYLKDHRAGEMAQWLKVPAAKLESLSSMQNSVVEGEN